MDSSLAWQLSQLPKKPGVYIFRGQKNKPCLIPHKFGIKQDKPLYVGKAVNLKNRVSYYLKPKLATGTKTSALVSQIKKIDYIETESEIEALLLEANLIKKHQPRFNTRAKDDKSYLYIRITKNEEIPQVKTARLAEVLRRRAGVYFGPFPKAETVRQTLRALRRIFPYCHCNLKLCARRQSCLLTDIGLDAGVCVGKISKEEYRQIINRLILFLRGRKKKVLAEFKKEMGQAAKNLDFEKAADLKKKIEGILYLTSSRRQPAEYVLRPTLMEDLQGEEMKELQKVLNLKKLPERIECFDISNILGKQATGSMVTFVGGEPEKNFYRRFKVKMEGKPNDVAMLKEVLTRRLKHEDWPLPDLMVIDGGKPQLNAAISVVKEFNLKIPVISLAKREEEIYIEVQLMPLTLGRDSGALQLLQRLRDEAHRFAISYHKKIRTKSLLGNS